MPFELVGPHETGEMLARMGLSDMLDRVTEASRDRGKVTIRLDSGGTLTIVVDPVERVVLKAEIEDAPGIVQKLRCQGYLI